MRLITRVDVSKFDTAELLKSTPVNVCAQVWSQLPLHGRSKGNSAGRIPFCCQGEVARDSYLRMTVQTLEGESLDGFDHVWTLMMRSVSGQPIRWTSSVWSKPSPSDVWTCVKLIIWIVRIKRRGGGEPGDELYKWSIFYQLGIST